MSGRRRWPENGVVQHGTGALIVLLGQCPEISAPQPRPSAVNSTPHLSKGHQCSPVGNGNLNLKCDVFFQTGATSSYPENKIWSDNFWALPCCRSGSGTGGSPGPCAPAAPSPRRSRRPYSPFPPPRSPHPGAYQRRPGQPNGPSGTSSDRTLSRLRPVARRAAMSLQLSRDRAR